MTLMDTFSLTAIKSELKVNQVHVDQIFVDSLMSDLHSDMLNFHDVALERSFQTLVEIDELGDLS